MSWAYASTADLTAAFPELSGLTTAALLRLLTGAADDIDSFCGRNNGLRTFRTYTAALTFDPVAQWLEIPDLLSLTTLKQDVDRDGVFEVTWATTDYFLVPRNAPVSGDPYLQIRPAPGGQYRFDRQPWGWTGGWPREYLSVFSGNWIPAVEVTGKWGYRETLEDTSATLNGAISSTSATMLTASNGALLGIGQTILVDSEQMFISNIAANTVTVERGINGTTAATHLTAAPISRYVYPSKVVDATFGVISARRAAPARAGLAALRVGDITETYGRGAAGSVESMVGAALDEFVGDLRRVPAVP